MCALSGVWDRQVSRWARYSGYILHFLMTMSIYFEAGSCSNVNDFDNINQFLTANLLSKEEGKDQKSIQSNTTHHTGHHMGK